MLTNAIQPVYAIPMVVASIPSARSHATVDQVTLVMASQNVPVSKRLVLVRLLHHISCTSIVVWLSLGVGHELLDHHLFVHFVF